MPRLIDRYVLREVVPPFLVGLLLITFVLLMNQILLLADLFIDKGVPPLQALRVLGLLVPSLLVFALPMAVLMGILGGLARLAADSEIVAFGTLGVGPRRLARPLLLFGLAGSLLTLPLALYFAPRANHEWVRTMAESVLTRVRLKVEPLEFNETLPGMMFLAREVGADRTWRDVFVYLGRDPAHPRVILARSGSVRLFPEQRRAILDLADGHIYSGPLAAPGEDTLTAFDRMAEEIDVEGLFPAVSSEKRVREKDIGELVRDLRGLEAAPGAGPAEARRIRSHRIEIHKKMALPAACLAFALLGLPLGLATGRAGRTAGFSLSLGLIVLYYALITAGEKEAMEGRISAFLGMWGADLLLAAAGAWLFLKPGRGTLFPLWKRAARKEGPRPPAVLEAARACGRPCRPSGPAVRFPGLLDRYVARKFLALWVLVLAALCIAAFVATFFESLNEALQNGKPVALLVRYVWFKLPEYLSFILPASVLMAALLALGLLTRTNEATAMKAAGLSAYRIAVPVLVLALAVGGLAFLIQERIVPAAHAKHEAAWGALNDLPPRISSSRNRHWVLAGKADRIYHYDYFEPGPSTFGRLSVFEIDTARWVLRRRVFAEKAAFESGGLAYRDAWIREFGDAPGRPFIRSAGGRLDAADDEDAFRSTGEEPLQMTLGDLRRYTAEVRAMGFPAVRLRAELAQKVALPFVSLIMALLAVPFGYGPGRKGALVGIGLGVVVAMAYWGTFAVCRSLGGAGVLPPLLGAWGANALFGLAGLVGLLRLRT